MAIKSKKISNLIIITIMIAIFINCLSLSVHAIDPDVAAGVTSEEVTEEKTDKATGLMPTIRNVVAQWYYIFRYFSITAMLIVLIYLGINLAITSSASDKAKYKRMLMDWLVGFVIIFCIHYFMIFVLKVNSGCLKFIQNIAEERSMEIALTKGIETCENKIGGKPCRACETCQKILASNSIGLYETIRTRAYEFRAGIGTSGMIMYMVLVYYTIRFTIIYFKRFFTLMILTIVAPLVGLSYAFTKVMSGKAPIITTWGREYCFNVFLQTIHAFIYTIFVTMALEISTVSIAGFIVALVMFNFMLKAEKIFRKIFKFSGKLVDDNADKDFKENFAALTAIKAAATSTLGGAMAKDAVKGIKTGVGTVANWGLVGGAMAYNAQLKKNNSKLAEKKLLKEKKDFELSKAKNEEDKKKAKAEKEKLDKQITRMENRRNKMNNYTQLNKKAKTEQMTKKIEQEYKNRINRREELGLRELNEKEKNKLKSQIEMEMTSQVRARVVDVDKYTGETKIIDGIAYQLKGRFNKAVWKDDSIKKAQLNMIKSAKDQMIGNFMLMAAIPMTVANPGVGLAMLGKGVNKVKSTNNLKKVTTYKERKRLKQSKKATIKKQKLKFNRFNVSSLKTIQANNRMKIEANMIRNINAPTVGMRTFTFPLRMLGVTGAARNAMANQYQVDKSRKKYYQNEEASYAIARKDSVSKDFRALYGNTVFTMEEEVAENMTFEDAIIENRKAVGQVYEVNDINFEFRPKKKIVTSTLIDSVLIDTAILNVAEKNNIVDLNEMSFNDKLLQRNAIEELSSLGILTNSEILDVDEPTKELSLMFKKLETRKKILQKKAPELAKEKLVQKVTSEYMKENEIESSEEIKKEEHVNKIKEIVFEKLSTKKSEEIEDKQIIFDKKIEDIVRNVIEKTDDEDERISLITDEVNKVIFKEKEMPNDESVDELLEKLILRKQEIKIPYTISKENMPKIKDEIYSIEPLVETKEKTEDIVVEEKTKEFMRTFDIKEVISTIKKKDKEKQETESFIEDIISTVEEVKDTPILTKEEEKIKESPEEVRAFIRNTAKRKIRTSKEFKDLNAELREFDAIKDLERVPEEYTKEKEIPGQYDQLISHLIDGMKENKVLVDLKVTKPTDKRVLAMNYIDEERKTETYNNTNIEDILDILSTKKKNTEDESKVQQ